LTAITGFPSSTHFLQCCVSFCTTARCVEFSVGAASSDGPLLDFRKSHGSFGAAEVLRDQLIKFLQKANTASDELSDVVKTELNRLIAAVRTGVKISGLCDIKRYFTREKVINKFHVESRDGRIVWDIADGIPVTCDKVETMHDKRRWTCDQIAFFDQPRLNKV